MKADSVWSISVHAVREFKGHKTLGTPETLACGPKLLHIFNMFGVRAPRQTSVLSNETVTYLWPLSDQGNG